MTVVLEGVSKRYGRRRAWVLRNVDLALPEASITVLTGANGSGKTTLLRIAAGFSTPTRGTVRGRADRVAVVPDRFACPVRMTGRTYLHHQGRIRGLTSRAAQTRASELGEQLAVSPSLDVPMQELSKGNAQKISLAQAFMAPVDLLVLDEPHTALDVHADGVLQGLLDHATREGTSILLSDPAPARSYPKAHRYQVASGRLEPVRVTSGDQARVTILLRPRASQDSPAPPTFPAHWAAALEPHRDGVAVDVGAGYGDEVLYAALSQGWSVLEVRRTPAPASERAEP